MIIKKKSSTIVATVFYEKSLNNLKSFLTTLEKQDDKDFDVLVCNDGIKELDKHIKSKLNIQIINCFGSINENRISMINYCKKKKYKNIIFIDSDDYVDKKRISTAKKYLTQKNVIVNDLNLIDSNNNLIKKNFFSNRIKNKSLITVDDILDKNFIGMSNTSARTKIFKKLKLNKLKNAPIFDWALWFTVLRKNNGLFTNETNTYYKSNTPNNLTTLIKNRIRLNSKKLKKKQLNFLNLKEKKLSNQISNSNIKKSLKNNMFWWE